MTDRQRSFNYPDENHNLKVFTILIIDSFYSCYLQELALLVCRNGVMRHGVTSRDITVWRHMASYVMAVSLHVPSHQKIHVFQHGDLDLWPMTLTFELIRDIIMVHTSTKFWVCTSNSSPMRALTDTHTLTHTQRQTDRQTHRHTVGTDSIPSSANKGGKNCFVIIKL